MSTYDQIDSFPITIDDDGITLKDISLHFYGKDKDGNPLLSPQTLLEFKNDSIYGGSLTNEERIYAMYNDEDKKTFAKGQWQYIKFGTSLVLPIPGRFLILESQRPTEYTGDINEISEAYWTANAKTYLDKMIELKSNNLDEYFIKRRNKYYIKIWSRVLNEVIYISSYSTDFNISVGDDGGNFGFSLSAIAADYRNGKWQIANLQEFGDEQSFSKTNIVYDYKVYDYDLAAMITGIGWDNGQKKKTFTDLYFEKVLNPQDLVFIKLDEPFINPTALDYTDDYDMIGAIDSVKPIITQNENTIEASIKISGRDLMKLFVEDGTYFFPQEYYIDDNGSDNIINSEDKIKPGSYNYKERIFGKLFAYILSGGGILRDWLDFIKKHLSITDWDIPMPMGIWQYIDFRYEPKAGNRWITKPSISTMSGSSINFLRQFADHPFVEILTDTFGSLYTMIFRTPPFARDAYLNNRTLEISMRYLISNDTGIDDKNIRSWYWMKPEAFIFGANDSGTLMKLFPPVYFSKLAKIYGSKKMDVQHKYSYYKNSGAKEKLDSKLQTAKDFKWLIESFVSEPFMKKGTLTFKNISGIKKGINIYIPETDMLYYVKSYSHTISINDRTTTIQVERGIPKRYANLFYKLVKVNINEDENEINFVSLDEDVLKKLMEKKYD